MLRIVMLSIVTSSSSAPSTDSSARPQQYSNTQFEIVMFLNPPLDSVPNLIRPVALSRLCLRVPSSNVPSSYPLTWQLVMVTFSVAIASPSPNDDLRQMPSSPGELTVQLL